MYVCGVRIDELSLSEVADTILDGKGGAVYTPNAVMLERAMRDRRFLDLLNRSKLNVPDGVGTVKAAKLLCGKTVDKVAGVDLGIEVAKRCADTGKRLFLFGGKDGVAKKAKARLTERIPGLCICGTRSGYGDISDVADEIKRSGADVVFVCLGSPMQEIWIDENEEKLPDCALLGLGGSMDVYSGNVKRAPAVFEKSGFEWLYRMAREPKRLKNIIPLTRFFIRVIVKCVQNKF